MRSAKVKFYLANSDFNKEELADIISESLFQLELLGYPSITKRVDSLVSGLSRGPKGGNSHDNRCCEDNAEEVWGSSSLEIRETADAQRDLNRKYREALETIVDYHYRSFHDFAFRPCVAGPKNGGQETQVKTPKQIYQAQGEWVKKKKKEGILK